MRILYIGYPLLAVNEESCGGAEQVLGTVERGMHARGHDTAVAAATGSRCAGKVVPTGDAADVPGRLEQREREQWAAIQDARNSRAVTPDIIHDHSGSFWRHAAELPIPVLATLHLPRTMYAPELFLDTPANVFFNCVSRSQAEEFRELPGFGGVVENGIELDRFPLRNKKDDFVLWLGRICEEKAPHLAIAASQRAGVSLVLAGDVYPFCYHMEFWEREVAPQVDGTRVSFVRRPIFSAKLDLLRRARAVLIPSQVAETSSLVAMEAMACGTPVIAFRRGALAQIIADGETGFLVDSVQDMAWAIARADEISSEACRARVAAGYSHATMLDGYERLYREVVEHSRNDLLAAAG